MSGKGLFCYYYFKWKTDFFLSSSGGMTGVCVVVWEALNVTTDGCMTYLSLITSVKLNYQVKSSV